MVTPNLDMMAQEEGAEEAARRECARRAETTMGPSDDLWHTFGTGQLRGQEIGGTAA